MVAPIKNKTLLSIFTIGLALMFAGTYLSYELNPTVSRGWPYLVICGLVLPISVFLYVFFRPTVLDVERALWKGILLVQILFVIALFTIFEPPEVLSRARGAFEHPDKFAVLFTLAASEELLFRVVLIQILLSLGVRSIWAVIIAAVFFGSTHFPEVISATIAGLIYGWLYVSGTSLLVITILHFLWNVGAAIVTCNRILLHSCLPMTTSGQELLIAAGLSVLALKLMTIIVMLTHLYKSKRKIVSRD
jgi:membrane protease YdiL (CAAX protease family)